MKSEENKTEEKKKPSLFSETRISKNYKSTLTHGSIPSSSQISRDKPTDEEWFQVWGETMDDLEEMAIVKIMVGGKPTDYIIRGTEDFKEEVKNQFRKVRMVRMAYYVTSNQRLGLWPVSIPIENKDGTINPYTATANEIIEQGQHEWVKKITNRGNSYYEGYKAKPEDQQIFGKPNFRVDYEEAVVRAFDKFFITVDSVETDPHVRQALGSSLNLKSIQEAEENKFTKNKK